jgi:hypothetical protein
MINISSILKYQSYFKILVTLLGTQHFEVKIMELAEEEIIKYFISFKILVTFYSLERFPLHKFGEE